MEKEFDYLVFIGRFQPFHYGHLNIVKTALERARMVVIVLGSCGEPRNVRNPFTKEERKAMILSCFDEAEAKRIHFIYAHDWKYNDERWVFEIQNGVSKIVAKNWQAGPLRVGLIGHKKDGTSYYLKKFPTWASINVPQDVVLSATDIRECIYENDFDQLHECLPPSVATEVKMLMNVGALDDVLDECDFNFEYNQKWGDGPFNTVDAVVIAGGHILLVKRGHMPGKGLYALPGGFIHLDETLQEAMVRELYEEVRIDLPKAVIRGSISNVRTFDDPFRSNRARIITTAFYVNLGSGSGSRESLPRIRVGEGDNSGGETDPEILEVAWVPLSELKRENMFEDHYCIVSALTGIL